MLPHKKKKNESKIEIRMLNLELYPFQLHNNIGLFNQFDCGLEIPLKCSGRKL